VVIQIGGETLWLWRVVDAKGDALDSLVQKRRNAKAAKRFFKRLLARYGDPRIVVTDKLRSSIKPIRTQAPNATHRAHKGLNNRAEGSHRPTSKARENNGPVQIAPPSTKISRRSRSDQRHFPSTPLSPQRSFLPPRTSRRISALARLYAGDNRLKPANNHNPKRTPNNLAMPGAGQNLVILYAPMHRGFPLWPRCGLVLVRLSISAARPCVPKS
jgi:hypothetical protein